MNFETNEQIHMQRILKSRYSEIKSRQPQYSIRAFARKVGIAPGTLSLIMLGKRKISRKLAAQIATSLMLDPQERSEVMEKFSPLKVTITPEDEHYMQISSDQFDVISEWHYFAILNLIKTSDFKSDIDWISNRLNLTKKKVSDAINRLERLGLLTIDEDGNFKRSNPKYRTTDDVSSIALRKSHHETLNLAHEALDRVSLQDRDFTWLTFAFDKTRMEKAKTLIRKFQDEFLDIVQEESNPKEVYRMSIQLFPLTKLERSKYENN